ncbi:hypothetical protein LJC23_00810 [Desulfovibrio sp. OttesenSCG-928-I05]|nr:hypothetical protein [Desulfovibrio sp. OttesenSCG-928-I05]
MDFLHAHFGMPLPLWLPVAFGLTGAFIALLGSLLRGRLRPGTRRLGSLFCVLGLGLMTVALITLGSRNGSLV